MEEIMSRQKIAIGRPLIVPTRQDVRSNSAVVGAKPPAPEVVNLEIDDNDDFGSDPYNRTGTHCVLKIGDDA